MGKKVSYSSLCPVYACTPWSTRLHVGSRSKKWDLLTPAIKGNVATSCVTQSPWHSAMANCKLPMWTASPLSSLFLSLFSTRKGSGPRGCWHPVLNWGCSVPQPLILPVFTELQCVLAQLGTCSVPTTLAANTGEAAITRGLPSCTHTVPGVSFSTSPPPRSCIGFVLRFLIGCPSAMSSCSLATVTTDPLESTRAISSQHSRYFSVTWGPFVASLPAAVTLRGTWPGRGC